MGRTRKLEKTPLADDHAGLLKAIWDNPADDTPRLVFADYLDDVGTPEASARAAFIRAQIAAAAEHASPGRNDMIVELGTRKGFVWTARRILLFRPWSQATTPDARGRMVDDVSKAKTVIVHSQPRWQNGGAVVTWHRGFPAAWTRFSVYDCVADFLSLPVVEFAGLGQPGNPYPDNPDSLAMFSSSRLYHNDNLWCWQADNGGPGRHHSHSFMLPRAIADKIPVAVPDDTFTRSGRTYRFESPTVAMVALSRAIGAVLRELVDAEFRCREEFGCKIGYPADTVFWPSERRESAKRPIDQWSELMG